MTDTTIIVNIAYQYIDVAEVFFELLRKNWSDCPYRIVCISDVRVEQNFVKDVFIRQPEWSLPYSIYMAAKKFPSKYYLCLLGDAFVNSKVDTDKFESFVNKLSENKIQYCNLLRRKYTHSNEPFEYLYIKEKYGVAFVSFLASKSFIEREFQNRNFTDYDFEIKYLKNCSKADSNAKYIDFVRINGNGFQIAHGVQKGKWIRKTYKQLIKTTKSLSKSERPLMGWIDTLKMIFSDVVFSKISPSLRIKIKKCLHAIGIKLETDY